MLPTDYPISPIHTPFHRPMAPGSVFGGAPAVSKRSCFGDVPLGGCGKLEQVMKHSDVLVKGDKIVDAVTWVRK